MNIISNIHKERMDN